MLRKRSRGAAAVAGRDAACGRAARVGVDAGRRALAAAHAAAGAAAETAAVEAAALNVVDLDVGNCKQKALTLSATRRRRKSPICARADDDAHHRARALTYRRRHSGRPHAARSVGMAGRRRRRVSRRAPQRRKFCRTWRSNEERECGVSERRRGVRALNDRGADARQPLIFESAPPLPPPSSLSSSPLGGGRRLLFIVSLVRSLARTNWPERNLAAQIVLPTHTTLNFRVARPQCALAAFKRRRSIEFIDRSDRKMSVCDGFFFRGQQHSIADRRS